MKDILFKLKILYYHLASAFESWHENVWVKDLDCNDCCDGDMCACGGQTVREIYENCIGKD